MPSRLSGAIRTNSKPYFWCSGIRRLFSLGLWSLRQPIEVTASTSPEAPTLNWLLPAQSSNSVPLSFPVLFLTPWTLSLEKIRQELCGVLKTEPWILVLLLQRASPGSLRLWQWKNTSLRVSEEWKCGLCQQGTERPSSGGHPLYPVTKFNLDPGALLLERYIVGGSEERPYTKGN